MGEPVSPVLFLKAGNFNLLQLPKILASEKDKTIHGGRTFLGSRVEWDRRKMEQFSKYIQSPFFVFVLYTAG